MDWKTDYAAKRTTAAEAMKCVKSGDRVVFAHACGEPLELVDALVARAAELEHVEINHMVAMGKGEYARPEYAGSFFHKSLFVGASTREAVKDGRGDYIPVFFHEIPKLFCEGYLPPDVVLVHVSPPGQARLLLVRHLRRLHQAGGAGRQDRRRPGQPQHAAHPRRRLHPRVRDRPRRRERAGRHRAAAAADRPGRGGHRQAHRRPRRRRLLPAARHRRHPRRRARSSCTRRTTSASTARCSARASSTSTTRASSPTPGRPCNPGKMVADLPHGHAPPLRLRRRQPGRQHVPGQLRQRPLRHRPERPRRGHQLGDPGRRHGPGRRRRDGREPVHRHRRPGRLRARRRPQPRRQGDHRLAVHGEEGRRLAHRRRALAGHRGHDHARRRRLHRHRARRRPPARPRPARARGGAHRDRRPGVQRPDPGGGGRPCTASAASAGNHTPPRRAESHGARTQRA